MESPTSIAGHAPDSPGLEYSRRLAAREAQVRRLHRRHIWIGNLRVIVFFGAAALGWKIGKTGSPSIGWLAVAILVFAALVVAHRRTLRALNTARRAVEVYRRGLARIAGTWAGSGDTGEQFLDPGHVYAEDLDIVGPGSLFQLLCGARTRMGKQRLARWLLAPASLREIQERQAAARELQQKLDLREDLAVAGESDSVEADPAKLSQWATQDRVLNYTRLWPWATGLALLACAVIAGRLLSPWASPFLLLLFINPIVTFWHRGTLETMFAGLPEASRNLDSVAGILRRIETAEFDSPRLRALQAGLLAGGRMPSACIAGFNVLCNFEESRRNMVVQVLDLPLLYSVQLACALERWRGKYGRHIPAWLDAIGEIEALQSIGAYAFEHPADPFPEFSEEGSAACFEGEALGHPLLPEDQCIRNSIALGGPQQIFMVSGSNMSGKSTLLRVAGINAVLAMMGAPVRASRLRLSPLSVGASMRISDSLQKGVSHFYAEISRMRDVVELSRRGSLLFLFDEVLQGTNSSDRRAGAEGVIRTLLQRGALGLVTTHDLTLTSIADAFPQRIRNVHFQEKLEAGKLSFDYHLQDGIVKTSNGIELMRSIGLDV